MLFKKGIDIFIASLFMVSMKSSLFMVSMKRQSQIIFVAVDLLQGHIERKVAGETALAP